MDKIKYRLYLLYIDNDAKLDTSKYIDIESCDGFNVGYIFQYNYEYYKILYLDPTGYEGFGFNRIGVVTQINIPIYYRTVKNNE